MDRTEFKAAIVQNWTIRDKRKIWWPDDGEEELSLWDGQVLAIRPNTSPYFPESPWDN